MAERTGNNAPPYSEAQTKAWLTWLARGMQQHGQTVFMLEQLQPTWLATSDERAVYTLVSRLIFGLLYGLIFGAVFWCYWSSIVCIGVFLAFGFISGLSIGILDVFRSVRGGQSARPKTPTPWQRFKGVCIVGAVLLVAFFLGLFPVAGLGLIVLGRSGKEEVVHLQNLIVGVQFLLFLPTLAILWGVRSSQRTPGCDIQSVETLTWSWKAWRTGCAPFLILGLGLGLVIDNQRPMIGAIVGLLFASVPGLLFGAVAGLRPGVQEMKTVPNQGINLSMRCAIYKGLVVGLIAALILWLNAFIVRAGNANSHPSASDALRAGLVDGLVLGLAVALCVGTWFGGLDVLLHYFLRLLLYVKGRSPLNLVRFLDYAAKDLNFLQKVGGGYIFIHRMLLDYFADIPAPHTSVKR